MYSLKVFLVSILIVSINGAPTEVQTTSPETEYEIDADETTPEPFDPEQYKQYLIDLKCVDIVINHGGTKISEVLSATSYKDTTTTTERSSDKHSEAKSDKLPEYVESSKNKGVHETPDKKTPEISDYDEDTKVLRSKRSTGSSEVSTASSNNAEKVNNTEVCTAPLTEKWDTYNWYQILVDNGGAPGNLDVSGPKPNLTKARDPCERPLRFDSKLHTKVWYITKSLQPDQRVYRQERVSLMFPDTPHEFADVSGLFVWSPPGEKHRSYHIDYRKDDTGLYVSLEREQRCRFTDPVHTFGIKCENVGSIECTCENDREVCMELGETPISLSPGLLASLAGK